MEFGIFGDLACLGFVLLFCGFGFDFACWHLELPLMVCAFVAFGDLRILAPWCVVVVFGLV